MNKCKEIDAGLVFFEGIIAALSTKKNTFITKISTSI